ncbi:MAG TPA: DUF2384 domain-containing protein [Catalimonadaceae bacterium]|jgi:putative toxin-antitoxin system antitoxin component (TIGR02293 family)|nr:DUF2384 domain-containing protein [Catalimonadaceae bacterium]
MGKKKSSPNPEDSMVSEASFSYGYSYPFNPALLGARPLSSSVKPLFPNDPIGAIRLIKAGISKSALDDLLIVTGLTSLEIADYLHVSERTLRNYVPTTLLNPEMSERILEIAQLYERGSEVFGSLDSFKKYMDSNNLALGGQKPKAFLDTSVGIQYLLQEVGKIEHGVFA